MYRYSIFETALGYMGVVGSSKGLHMVILPQKRPEDVKRVLKARYTEELVRDEEGLAGIKKKLKAFMKGEKVKFKEKLDATGITPFEMKVWDTVYGIPYGETRSYHWVAKQIGNPKEVRAVGQALKHNRLPVVIPCHRVINKSGDLGGYSGGVDLKRKLLKLEGRIW